MSCAQFIDLGSGGPDLAFVTSWSTRDAACQEALEELDRRGPARLVA